VTFPRTASALRAILEERGLAPRKGQGQCFLTDPQAVDAIVRDAGVAPGDHVVEVGTGPGLLTHVLCEAGASVDTFDLDEGLLSLARELRVWPDRVRFHGGDVLAGKHALSRAFVAALERRPPPPGRLLLVSNLPYGAGTPILLGVLSLPDPPDHLVVMLQLEVAEKILARPGDEDYGAPSVSVGLKAEGKILRRFGPEVFWPRPRVRSAVARIVPRRPVPLEAADHRPFGAFVTALFTHRRKVLPTALRLAVPALAPEDAARALGSLGLLPTARVEELAPERILALWRASGSPDPAAPALA
jgi:16S rRNA (adenine1518-N6/adenine1519-N6)-dimethyltransferase